MPRAAHTIQVWAMGQRHLCSPSGITGWAGRDGGHKGEKDKSLPSLGTCRLLAVHSVDD